MQNKKLIINNTYLKNQIRKADKYSFWIDYIRVSYNFNNKKIIELIEELKICDFDNSNFIIKRFWDLNITFIKSLYDKGISYMGVIYYKNNSYPIICIEDYSKKQKEFTGNYWSVVLYGSYYRLEELLYINIKKFLNEFLYDTDISRVDYRIDFFYNKDIKIINYKKLCKLRKKTKIKEFREWEKLTGWIVWSRWSKRYITRWYDKLLDSEKKGKFDLYADYFDFKKVYRLEFEFLNHFCKGFKYQAIEELKEKIKLVLWYNSLYKDRIYRSYEKTDLTDIEKRFKYANTTSWYIVNCIKSGINIFWLLEESFYKAWLSEDEIKQKYIEYIERNKWSADYITNLEDLYYKKNNYE